MSVKYEKVEFDHAWQAAKAVCDGEKLYSYNADGEQFKIESQERAIKCAWADNIWRKVKPSWWEKLDGTEENSVLAEGKVYMFNAVNFIDGLVVADDEDTYAAEYVTPIPSTQIEQWLKNAKEIEND